MRTYFIWMVIVLSFAVLGNLYAQKMVFSKIEHDFGTIYESDGLVTYKFEFTNNGDAPLILTKVEPTCGCTTPDWPKQPVMPKAKSYISATYDPHERPGTFYKSIKVSSNDPKKSMVEIFIKGDVIPKDKTDNDIYPINVNGVRFNNINIAFAKIKSTDTKKLSIEVFNSNTAEAILAFEGIPAHVSIKSPAKLKAKEKAKIEITYDAKKQAKRKFASDVMVIKVNGKAGGANMLKVSATIE